MGSPAKHNIKIKWAPNFAYAVGLITSDGSLHKNGRHIFFKSAEYELIENFKTSTHSENKVVLTARGGESVKKYYQVQFSDVAFYDFLNSIGITNNKSKTIKSVNVPDGFFPDFLRGLFDGDGTFYSFWDKRWPNSFGFQLSFASASFDFITWLKQRLTELYQVKGFICKGAGVFNLRYVKGDSKKIAGVMYYRKRALYLKRKYDKIKQVVEFDANLRGKNAAVAQW